MVGWESLCNELLPLVFQHLDGRSARALSCTCLSLFSNAALRQHIKEHWCRVCGNAMTSLSNDGLDAEFAAPARCIGDGLAPCSALEGVCRNLECVASAAGDNVGHCHLCSSLACETHRAAANWWECSVFVRSWELCPVCHAEDRKKPAEDRFIVECEDCAVEIGREALPYCDWCIICKE
eukprot:6209891-Pleurochrysis_carterae.AAC.2